MIQAEASLTRPGRLAVLARDFQARILNCSPSGCLIETNARVEVGTIGTLCCTIAGRQLADDVQIVRCQPIEGAGSLYHVGARFVLTASLEKGLLRRAFAEMGALTEAREAQVVG